MRISDVHSKSENNASAIIVGADADKVDLLPVHPGPLPEAVFPLVLVPLSKIMLGTLYPLKKMKVET